MQIILLLPQLNLILTISIIGQLLKIYGIDKLRNKYLLSFPLFKQRSESFSGRRHRKPNDERAFMIIQKLFALARSSSLTFSRSKSFESRRRSAVARKIHILFLSA